jgi:thiol-disulfide isomerase/thioredoxin
LAFAAALVLAGCVGGTGTVDTGYVSGDGTVTTWSVAERAEPVELSGTAFDGTAVDVMEYRGQVVVINTWYAACPPCRAEAPDLVEIDARTDVQVLGVNGRDDAGTGLAFERTFSILYPTIDDADGHAIAALQGLVALNAVPTTLVLDTEGRVAARIIGRAEPSTLDALILEAAGTA